MNQIIEDEPQAYEAILESTTALGFTMASDRLTGRLLKTLVAAKAGGRVLELGTGTGLATAWILDGMDVHSSLLSIESDATALHVAEQHLADTRVEFLNADAYQWLRTYNGDRFDFIFADAMPGKYDLLEETLSLVNAGGFYIVDDMLPQANWPEGHDRKVERLITELEGRDDLVTTRLDWSTGIIISVKKIKLPSW